MYRYGLVARPFMPGNCPEGYVDVERFDTWTDAPGDDPRTVRAIVTYDRPLTAAELSRYAMSQVGGGRLEPDVEFIAHAIDTGEGFHLGGWQLDLTPEGWSLMGPNFGPCMGMTKEEAAGYTLMYCLD